MKRKDAVQEAFESGEVFDAHRTFGRRFFFSTEDLEFGFRYFFGTVTHGGVEFGEMLYIASRVNEKKLASFSREAILMAERVCQRARQSLKNGHIVSAREGLLRASYYYRIAGGVINPREKLLEWQAAHKKSRELFKEAAANFNPPIETIEIPFEGTNLPGYFVKPDESQNPRKTIVMIGGTETFAEDLYFYLAPAAIKRGYNFVTIDIPGQGELPVEGKFFRHDTEVPISVIVDYLLSRPDVDAERLAFFGYSGGGYLIPRACAYEPRIRACIANSMLFDLDRIWRTTFLQFGELFKKRDPLSWLLADVLAWRWGCKDPLALIPANKDFKFDPSLIKCPVLIVIGEGEYFGSKESRRQQDVAMERMPNPNKKIVIVRHEEGAGAHVTAENLSLLNQIVFDWLDEVFEPF